jgi:hypothetical protein
MFAVLRLVQRILLLKSYTTEHVHRASMRARMNAKYSGAYLVNGFFWTVECATSATGTSPLFLTSTA